MTLTYDRLREYLTYDPQAGLFTWIKKKPRGRVREVGAVAGSDHGNGYRIIRLDAYKYYVHRLAWLYMTGKWPTETIDHINGDPADNRWDNLRAATQSQNMGNLKRPRHNTSGLKGASYSRANGRWLAQITNKGRYIYLGYYDSKEAAHAAYLNAATRLKGEFANPGS